MTGAVSEANVGKMTAMYGSAAWRSIYDARMRGELRPAAAREEYVNLMRWRLQEVLGYKWTHPLEFRNEIGNPIYHMIFATDHSLRTKIMTSVYSTAKRRFPAERQRTKSMRHRLAEEQRGVHNLFGAAIDDLYAEQAAAQGDDYEYEPPWPPYGSEEPSR